jgi:four helix bundle protein
MGFGAAMRILRLRSVQVFELTKGFPKEEVYSLTDQIRRSSRSVCANVAEAWRRRRYEGTFDSKLNDSEAEAAVPRLRSGCFAKTQTWLEFAVKCGYLEPEVARELYTAFDHIPSTSSGQALANWST